MLEVRDVDKRYGHTIAADKVSLEIYPGEMVSIAGHNGAGKSTLAKIIGGIVNRDAGEIIVNGESLPNPNTVRAARASGVALAFQEITLFPDLRVFEHVGAADLSEVDFGWRRRAQRDIKRQLDAMFPTHGISPQALVASLSLAQRQMMQIALSTVHPDGIRLLILDEPTSALSDDLATDLFAYLRRERDENGLSVVLVSHKIADSLNHSDRTVVMRDGAVVVDRPTSELTVRQLMTDMGAPPDAETPEAGEATEATDDSDDTRDVVVSVSGLSWRGLADVACTVRAGETVGLAGLESNGQRDLLEAVWRSRRFLKPRRIRSAVTVAGSIAYVSGDRQTEGLFPLWSVGRNMTIGTLSTLSRLGLVVPKKESYETSTWIEQISIKATAVDSIGSLSGGNQQKVLLARGMSQAPDLLILDDPFRGVDITTKAEAYRQLQDLADGGTAILWFTSENRELLECDRVYVLREGEVSAELKSGQLTTDQIILASFSETDDGGATS
ncbi:MAG: ABC transporter ATP-binding protein [Acidimicrobiales bacterium]|nr:MAG: ABC transporter ATP-binding protein [Acidimicrobiales bacterium]